MQIQCMRRGLQKGLLTRGRGSLGMVFGDSYHSWHVEMSMENMFLSK